MTPRDIDGMSPLELVPYLDALEQIRAAEAKAAAELKRRRGT